MISQDLLYKSNEGSTGENLLEIIMWKTFFHQLTKYRITNKPMKI